MKGTEMKSLKMSWTLRDGRLTAAWSEQPNERLLGSALWGAAPSAKSPASTTVRVAAAREHLLWFQRGRYCARDRETASVFSGRVGRLVHGKGDPAPYLERISALLRVDDASKCKISLERLSSTLFAFLIDFVPQFSSWWWRATRLAVRQNQQGEITMKKLLLGVLSLFFAIACFADDDSVACRTYNAIPVTLAPAPNGIHNISGEVCATKEELRAGATIQLLIHGATYNHDYWNFGKVNGNEYSYAREVAAHGFPTFAIDLPGSGHSSHPPSDELTVDTVAGVVHQIVQCLRSGAITGIAFGKVILVGHSLGSTVVWQEAISYGDVDGVIVTGAAHSLTTRFGQLAGTSFYPAAKDPKFAGSGLDSGYLTTLPGARKVLFYNAPDVDPAVLARDEARKDVVPGALLATGAPVATTNTTLAIHVPVLTILGSNDLPTCGPNTHGDIFDCSSGAVVAKQDASFYSPEARIHACVIPGSGHDVSFAVNNELQVADAVAWSNAFVGQTRDPERYDLGKRRSFNQSERALPWNDNLPWNCGGASSEPE
jgi:pimeloyl-ACP methyl ester carboxylesterase